MNIDYTFIITVATSIFAILNPIGNLPLFISLTQDMSDTQRRKTAFKALVITFIILSLFALGGKLIFDIFSVTISSLKISGGIILFLIALPLVMGKKSGLQKTHTDEKIMKERIENALPEEDLPDSDISISPLAIPLLAGPGAISTTISFANTKSEFIYTLLVIAALLINCTLTFIVFSSSIFVTKNVRPSIINIISRIMGLILTMIAVQMVTSGITNIVSPLKPVPM
ncbi:MarC family protein [Aureibacter tunicatorum]|uniref:UPF0056 membrane protein n=1 Tax=Aureibacter tunicatorum TaxID=866807 RepID=A0AAE3XQY1_9BACT|nr:MarC family protein [Aureibacter tunicatorum]MDR6240315.1 multiple antibiotic resistance protein [Aureibacter tunicatorum]BDD05804.1 UPF0056 inner membrane protein [Aureibacter tunicatorum]